MDILTAVQQQCIKDVLEYIGKYHRYPSNKDNTTFMSLRSQYMLGKLSVERMNCIEKYLPCFKTYIAKCKNSPMTCQKNFSIEELKNYRPETDYTLETSFNSDKSFMDQVALFIHRHSRYPNKTELLKLEWFKRKYFDSGNQAIKSQILDHLPFFQEYVDLHNFYKQENVSDENQHYDLDTLHNYKSKGDLHKTSINKRKLTAINTIQDIEKLPKLDEDNESSMLGEDIDTKSDSSTEPDQNLTPIDYVKLGIENDIITTDQIEALHNYGCEIKSDYKPTIISHNYYKQLDSSESIPSALVKEYMSLKSTVQPTISTDYLLLGFQQKIFKYQTYKAFAEKNIHLPDTYKSFVYDGMFEECLINQTDVTFPLFHYWVTSFKEPNNISRVNRYICTKAKYPQDVDFQTYIDLYQNGTLQDMMNISVLHYWVCYYVAQITNNIQEPDHYKLTHLIKVYQANKKVIVEQPMTEITRKRIRELIEYINKYNRYPPEELTELFIENLVYLYETNEHKEEFEIPYWNEFYQQRKKYINSQTFIFHRTYQISDLKNSTPLEIPFQPRNLDNNSVSSASSSATAQQSPTLTLIISKPLPVKPVPVKPVEDMFIVGLRNNLITFETIVKYRELNIVLPKSYDHDINLVELRHNIKYRIKFTHSLIKWVVDNKDEPLVKKELSIYREAVTTLDSMQSQPQT